LPSNTILTDEEVKKNSKKSMKLMGCFLMKKKDNNMMLIENEDLQADFEEIEDLISVDFEMEEVLILEISEIFYEECSEDFEDEKEDLQGVKGKI